MRGFLLTGPLGVGKTTIQRRLVSEHGFWTPMTMSTRPVDSHESHFVNVSLTDFRSGVAAGSLILPTTFGRHWYAWTVQDLDRLRFEEGKGVLNVRPYTALVLSAFLPDFVPVWLTLDPTDLQVRRESRAEGRDRERELRSLREAQDFEEQAYELLFPIRLTADEHLLGNLLEMLP